MINIIGYIIEANICLVLFGGLYYLLLKNETDFRFRRYYIISSTIVALIAPVFKLGTLGLMSNTSFNELPITILPELIIGDQAAQELVLKTTINYWQVSSIIYWVIAILLLQYFLFQIMQVIWFTFSTKTKNKKENGIIWVETNGTLPTFSFFNLLFYDNTLRLTTAEKERVINHELAHIHQKHSWDIILLETSKILCWINPFSWYMRREIQDIHEYLADEKVVTTTNSDEYKSLLAKMALNQAHLSIGHHFNKSKTLKRIQMMTTIKEKIKGWKMALTLPTLILMAVIVSCNDEVMQDVMETSSQVEVPKSLREQFASLQNSYPDAKFAYIETDGANKEALQNLQILDPKSVAHIEVFKDRGMVGIIFNKNGPFKSIEDKFTDGEVFTIVNEPATPTGGFEEYYKWISSELKYPVQAKELGVEGKVYVQFIINGKGEFTEVQVVKGIGAGCDNEAIRVISSSSNWSPPKQNGKAVKQRIILPITFALGDVVPEEE